MISRQCATCGKWFAAVGQRNKYCSKECALEAGRKRSLQNYYRMRDASKSDVVHEMAAITANACKAVDALTYRQRMRLEILFDTEGEGDGQDAD